MTIDDHRFMSIGQVQDQIKTGSVTEAAKKNTQQNEWGKMLFPICSTSPSTRLLQILPTRKRTAN